MELNLNQIVWDVADGEGVVFSFTHSTIVVMFGRLYHTYNQAGHRLYPGGIVSKNRSLYYSKPDVVGGTEPIADFFDGNCGDWVRVNVKSRKETYVGLYASESQRHLVIRIWKDHKLLDHTFTKYDVDGNPDIEVLEYNPHFGLVADQVYMITPKTGEKPFLFRFTEQAERTLAGLVQGDSSTILVKPFNEEYSLQPTLPWQNFKGGEMVMISIAGGVKHIAFVFKETVDHFDVDWCNSSSQLTRIKRETILKIERLERMKGKV